MNSYFTVADSVENVITIERSKFICYLKHVETEEDAKNFIAEIKKKNSLATHNCYAYIADDKGLVQKFSDDGEPQGTAGLPMLEILKNNCIYKTCAVVTRYFGGIKLGTGGLARAYGGSLKQALEKAKVLEMLPVLFVTLKTNYEGYSKILKYVSNKKIAVINSDFGEKITVKTAVFNNDDKSYTTFTNGIKEIFNGDIEIILEDKGYYGF